MKRKARIVILMLLLVCMVFVFTGCDLKYGTPDKLDIGGQSGWQRTLIGLQVAAIGMVTVFIFLALLILLCSLTKYIDKIKLPKKEKVEVEVKQNVIVEQDKSEEDEETVAVIMAVLMEYYNTNNAAGRSENKLNFRVRSIKEIK